MIELVRVLEESKEVLHNFYQLYHYDFSEFTEEDMSSCGIYELSLEHYWQDSRWNPYFMCNRGQIVGFLVILFENMEVDSDPTHVIYDFFVLKKFRRTGLGRQAAVQAYDLYRANWKTVQMSTNETAIQFWRDVIGDYSEGNYTELYKPEQKKYVQEFSTKNQ